MGLETGTYISDFVRTNPLGADDRSTADDHLRLIKDLILNTFPNLTGAMTATQVELNIMDGILSTTAELNRLQSFIGTINRTLITDSFGNIIVSPNVTAAELDFINSLSSNAQTQLNGKAPSAHSHTGAEISDLDAADTNSGVFTLARIPTIDQAKLGVDSVGQSEVKTANQLITMSSSARFTATGGIYTIGWTGDRNLWSLIDLQMNTVSQTPLSEWAAFGVSPSGNADWRLYYINSSPPYDLGDGEIPLFIYAVIDNTTGEVVAVSISPDPVWAYNGPTSIVANAVNNEGKKVIRIKDVSSLPDKEAAKTSSILQKAYAEALTTAPMIDLDPNDQAIKNADMNIIPHPFLASNGGVDPSGNPMLDLSGKTVVMLDPVSPVLEGLLAIDKDEPGRVGKIIMDGFIKIGNIALVRNGPIGLMIPSVAWKL